MASSAQMSTGRILVIDDETAMLEACKETLSHHGYQVRVCDSAEGGIEAVRRQSFDVVLVDLRMPGKDGLEVLRELESIDGSLLKIMVTGFPTISTAVEAVKEGAFDYLPKPFSPDQLLITVERALGQRRLAEENSMLRRTLRARPIEGIVARSPAMERVMDLVERLAEGDSSVVILGETGTGKELIARSLHANSRRSSAHFVPIDCGALPGQLLESELFGHERGAFTGAFTRKTGLLESAQGGTVFLDEIATLDIDLQAKLLRVLSGAQTATVGRSGGDRHRLQTHLRHQRGSRESNRRRSILQGPVLPHRRRHHRPSPLARARGRRHPARRPFRQGAQPETGQGRDGDLQRGLPVDGAISLARECARASERH